MGTPNWETSDLPAAAFAIYCGLDLLHVPGGNRAIFTFRATPAWSAQLATFLAGRALVEPARYHICLKAARAAVYDGNVRRAQEQAALARALGKEEAIK